MTSIFDVEKRLPLSKECERINSFINKNNFSLKGIYNRKFNLYQIIDESLFLNWPFRGTATCIKDYLEYFDIDFEKFQNNKINLSDQQYLYYLETLVNLVELVKLDINKQNNYQIQFENFERADSFISNLFRNINLTLESINFKIYKSSKSKIQFSKRDAEADSTIIAVKDRDIALDILSFLDFRSENNINEKKSIITRLYKHLEANQSTYKSIRIKSSAISKDINPYDDFFLLANKFDIRHHPKDLLKNGTFQNLDDNRTIEVLDICFRLFLRIVNTSQAVTDQDYINNLKQEFNIA